MELVALISESCTVFLFYLAVATSLGALLLFVCFSCSTSPYVPYNSLLFRACRSVRHRLCPHRFATVQVKRRVRPVPQSQPWITPTLPSIRRSKSTPKAPPLSQFTPIATILTVITPASGLRPSPTALRAIRQTTKRVSAMLRVGSTSNVPRLTLPNYQKSSPVLATFRAD